MKKEQGTYQLKTSNEAIVRADLPLGADLTLRQQVVTGDLPLGADLTSRQSGNQTERLSNRQTSCLVEKSNSTTKDVATMTDITQDNSS